MPTRTHFRNRSNTRHQVSKLTLHLGKLSANTLLACRDVFDAPFEFRRERLDEAFESGLCNANANVIKIVAATSAGAIPATRFV